MSDQTPPTTAPPRSKSGKDKATTAASASTSQEPSRTEIASRMIEALAQEHAVDGGESSAAGGTLSDGEIFANTICSDLTFRDPAQAQRLASRLDTLFAAMRNTAPAEPTAPAHTEEPSSSKKRPVPSDFLNIAIPKKNSPAKPTTQPVPGPVQNQQPTISNPRPSNPLLQGDPIHKGTSEFYHSLAQRNSAPRLDMLAPIDAQQFELLLLLKAHTQPILKFIDIISDAIPSNNSIQDIVSTESLACIRDSQVDSLQTIQSALRKIAQKTILSQMGASPERAVSLLNEVESFSSLLEDDLQIQDITKLKSVHDIAMRMSFTTDSTPAHTTVISPPPPYMIPRQFPQTYPPILRPPYATPGRGDTYATPGRGDATPGRGDANPGRGYYIATPGRGAGRGTSPFPPLVHMSPTSQIWVDTPNGSIPLRRDQCRICLGLGHHAAVCPHQHPPAQTPSRFQILP